MREMLNIEDNIEAIDLDESLAGRLREMEFEHNKKQTQKNKPQKQKQKQTKSLISSVFKG